MVELDFFLIGVENRISTCMNNNDHNFIVYLRPINNRVVKVYVVVINVRGKEILKWKMEDDDGNVHSIIIQNLDCVPEASI